MTGPTALDLEEVALRGRPSAAHIGIPSIVVAG
jgi:hypothetical protein